MSDFQQPMISQLGDPSAPGTPEEIIAGLTQRPMVVNAADPEKSNEPIISTYADDADAPMLLWDALRQMADLGALTDNADLSWGQLGKRDQADVVRVLRRFAETIGWDQ